MNKGDSVAQTIERLAFQQDGFLLQEFDNLFAALFGEQAEYANILRIIAQHRYGIGKNRLLEQLDPSQTGGQGINKLMELEEAGFIQSFKPHFHKRQGVYYRLIDEYLLFYFYWIEPIRSTLQTHAFEAAIGWPIKILRNGIAGLVMLLSQCVTNICPPLEKH